MPGIKIRHPTPRGLPQSIRKLGLRQFRPHRPRPPIHNRIPPFNRAPPIPPNQRTHHPVSIRILGCLNFPVVSDMGDAETPGDVGVGAMVHYICASSGEDRQVCCLGVPAMCGGRDSVDGTVGADEDDDVFPFVDMVGVGFKVVFVPFHSSQLARARRGRNGAVWGVQSGSIDVHDSAPAISITPRTTVYVTVI